MRIFLLVIVLFISFFNVLGCSPIGYPDIPLHFVVSRTGKIYMGKVISKKTWYEKDEDGDTYHVKRMKLKVERAIKGIDDKFQTITLRDFVSETGSCDEPPNLKVGEKWIIFENIFADNKLSANFPDYRKFSSREDAVYIEQLGNLITNPGTTVSGQIQTFKSLSSIDNAEILLEGENLKLTTKTNKNGEYSFKDVPAGEYKIKIPMPRKARDYFNDAQTNFDQATQKYYFEYSVSVFPANSDQRYLNSHYRYIVLDSSFYFKSN